jgi:FixJ family two-component response regulator
VNRENSVLATKLVIVVDDDESVREPMPDLLRGFGYQALAFSSAEELLASGQISEAHCLILDVAMPGMTGPELKQELARRGYDIPVIFITALTDETVLARLAKEGPVACLSKPFSARALRTALAKAIPSS